jgi:hypothetical protein
MLAPAALGTALRTGVGRGLGSKDRRGSGVDDIGLNEGYFAPKSLKD